MKSIFNNENDISHEQDLDLAPLLDVVFILLIFFIVTTVFVKETGVTVDKPSAVSSSDLNKDVLMIAITSDHQVMFAGTSIGVAGVRSQLLQTSGNTSKPLIIQADKRVPTDLLVKVMDQAKLAGVKSISIATDKG